jgi:hypothetical protein
MQIIYCFIAKFEVNHLMDDQHFNYITKLNNKNTLIKSFHLQFALCVALVLEFASMKNIKEHLRVFSWI